MLALLALVVSQSISGTVFLDANENGVREPGERGIARVAVSNQDTVVLTASDGSYRLSAGRGHGLVYVSVPDGYRSTSVFWRRTGDSASFGLAPLPTSREFTFVHASDTHISDESAPRTRRLRAFVDSLRPAFVLITGDLVRDALRVSEAEARGYYDLFVREKSQFAVPVHVAPGNHEIFGIETHLSKVPPDHPLFGKEMFRAYLGPDYYSFTHGGMHFVALNTVDVHEGSYYGHVDSLQLAWLARDLARLPAATPVVTFNHIPFYSTSELLYGYHDKSVAPTLIRVGDRQHFRHVVSNAGQVLAILATRRHPLALGGHVHLAEWLVYEREGQPTRFVNGAAILGPSRMGGHVFPSGFTVYTVRDGVIDQGKFVLLDGARP